MVRMAWQSPADWQVVSRSIFMCSRFVFSNQENFGIKRSSFLFSDVSGDFCLLVVGDETERKSSQFNRLIRK